MPSPAAAGSAFAPACPPAASEEREQAQVLLAALRARISRLDPAGRTLRQEFVSREPGTRPRWTTGVEAVDSHLPEQGLARHALHDIAPHNHGDQPAAMGFALALAIRQLEVARRKRPILWCRINTEQAEHGRLYGHGIVALGLPRRDFLTVTLRKASGLYWIFEEALKSGCFSAVLGDAHSHYMSLTISRRLALAAYAGKSAGLLIFSRNYTGATASMSRWQVETSLSPDVPLDPKSPGPPAWSVTLSRIRGGRPGRWMLHWSNRHIATHNSLVSTHAPHHFTLVSGFPGGALHPRPPEAAEAHSPAGPALRAG
jgi:protein ImuA